MRTGRPPKPPEERRTTDVRVPLSEDEKAMIWDAAGSDDMKPITWCRKIMMDAAKRRVGKQNGRAVR